MAPASGPPRAAASSKRIIKKPIALSVSIVLGTMNERPETVDMPASSPIINAKYQGPPNCLFHVRISLHLLSLPRRMRKQAGRGIH